MRQKVLDEVRVEVPYFRMKKWKNYPVSREVAIDTLESVKDELEEALASIEKQLVELCGSDAI